MSNEIVGRGKLYLYLGALDINDPQHRHWHPGTRYRPPFYFFVPEYGGWDVLVHPPLFGVIGYEAFSRTAGLTGLAVGGIYAGAKALSAISVL